jgi:hypothetical protein
LIALCCGRVLSVDLSHQTRAAASRFGNDSIVIGFARFRVCGAGRALIERGRVVVVAAGRSRVAGRKSNRGARRELSHLSHVSL